MVMSVSCAYAEHGWGGKDGNGDRQAHFNKIAEKLQLTPQQKTELDKQREAFIAKAKDLREKIRSAKTELMQELDKAVPDKAHIETLIAQTKELVGEQMRTKVDKVLAMKQVLTSEQFAKMKEFRQERKGDKHGEHSDHTN
jgi:Spy/CpxP family protein refolding chaperone